ncbi:hypothetical protein CLOM_g14104 [Closterium sp. NIES-68]|nr:hypothetical protein CLOM_g14104 [Closterium sp. NIES-68]GJP85561.1 hypothetical protein CLOP_g15643 [Closterium sp. NIES-67]
MAAQAVSTLAHRMPVAPRALSATAAVRASLDARVLESKSLGELRALARQRGLRGDTKAELVKMLSSGTNGAVAATPAAPVAAAAAPSGAGQSALARQLEVMPLGQLRAMARSKGIFGSTKAEIVAALTAASGAPAAAPSASPPAPAAQYSAAAPSAAAPAPSNSSEGGSSAQARLLAAKPVAVLRAMARQKGLRGNTKDELVAALLGSSSPSAFSSPAPTSASSPAPPPSAPSVPTSAPSSAAVGVSAQALSRQLQARPLSALRAMATAKGIPPAVSNKDQLIRALVAATTAAAAGVTEVRAAASVRAAELQGRPLAELRAMARQRGLRGDTKAELVKLLTASDPLPSTSIPTTRPPSATATTAATAATAGVTAVATATASPFASGINLPFQSDVPAGGTTAIQPTPSSAAASAGSASAAPTIQEAIELFVTQGREEEQEVDGLSEQAAFLRNVLVGGIGIAVLPLIIPMQFTAPVVSPPPPTATTPAAPVAPPPQPAPDVRELSPEEFCRTLPASLLSPEAARFCAAVVDLKL